MLLNSSLRRDSLSALDCIFVMFIIIIVILTFSITIVILYHTHHNDSYCMKLDREHYWWWQFVLPWSADDGDDDYDDDNDADNDDDDEDGDDEGSDNFYCLVPKTERTENEKIWLLLPDKQSPPVIIIMIIVIIIIMIIYTLSSYLNHFSFSYLSHFPWWNFGCFFNGGKINIDPL